MAFSPDLGNANLRHLGTTTYAEFAAWLPTVSTVADATGRSDRQRIRMCSVTITDRVGQEMWYVTPTSFLPYKDLNEGTMNKFKAAANGLSTDVANDETLNFNDSGLVKFGIDVATKAITAKIQGTSANVGQILTGDANGNAVFAPLPFTSVGDTATTHGFLDAGVVKFDAKLDTTSPNNLMKVAGNGMRVDAMTVAPASAGLISIDPATNQLIVEKLLSGEVETSTAADVAAWATAVTYNGTTKDALLQKLDVLVLKDATSGELTHMYLKTANTGVAATDLTEIPLHVVPAEVRAQFQGIMGIYLNRATGDISGVRDIVALRNDLTISANGFLVDVENASIEVKGLGTDSTKTLVNHLDTLYTKSTTNAGRADNMLSYDATSNKIQAGGISVKDTTTTAAHAVVFDATTGSYRYATDKVGFNNHWSMVDSRGYRMIATLTAFQQLEWNIDPNQ